MSFNSEIWKRQIAFDISLITVLIYWIFYNILKNKLIVGFDLEMTISYLIRRCMGTFWSSFICLEGEGDAYY